MLFTLTPHASPVFFVSAKSLKISGLCYIAVRSLFVRDVAWPGQVVG